MSVLDRQVIEARVAELSGWSLDPAGRLVRRFSFPDFAAALSFANLIGAESEAFGHHPDLLVSWGKLEVTLWTHDAGGLTDQDFAMVNRIDRAAQGLRG